MKAIQMRCQGDDWKSDDWESEAVCHQETDICTRLPFALCVGPKSLHLKGREGAPVCWCYRLQLQIQEMYFNLLIVLSMCLPCQERVWGSGIKFTQFNVGAR